MGLSHPITSVVEPRDYHPCGEPMQVVPVNTYLAHYITNLAHLYLGNVNSRGQISQYVPLPASKPPIHHFPIYSILPLHKMGFLDFFIYSLYERGI